MLTVYGNKGSGLRLEYIAPPDSEIRIWQVFTDKGFKSLSELDAESLGFVHDHIGDGVFAISVKKEIRHLLDVIDINDSDKFHIVHNAAALLHSKDIILLEGYSPVRADVPLNQRFINNMGLHKNEKAELAC
jgi:hypothetical protein